MTELWQTSKGLQYEILERRQAQIALWLSQARLAGILDTAEDAIISVDEAQRIQIFNRGAEKIFGYTADEVLAQPIKLLLSRDSLTVYCQHIQEFARSADESRKMQKTGEIWARRKDGSEFPAEASISKLEVGQETVLTVILRDITERKQSEEALKNQIARERLMAAIAQRIRQSLDINQILNTTVAEVRQFLKADRVIVYRFNADWSGVVAVESVSPEWSSILGSPINDHCFMENYVELYQNGRIQATEDIYNAGMLQCHVDLLAPLQVRANLVVPIVQTRREFRLESSPDFLASETSSLNTPDSEPEAAIAPTPVNTRLWGLLGVHQCSAPRQWQEWEIELIKQLATQVAIALQQAELYQQLLTANQQLRQLAWLDGLTQVANRRRFDEYLQYEWRRLARDQAPLSLILCDVDFFKVYNDTYGHLTGDICLQQVAAAIREAIRRPADLVARYGGEEFAVILPNTPSVGAVHVAEEIQSRVKALKIDHPKSQVCPYVTLSLGVATTIPAPKTSPMILIGLADRALYQAKAEGRDRAVAHNANP